MSDEPATNAWIALVDDEPVATATTPEDTLAAAKTAHPDQRPVLTYHEASHGAPLSLSPLLERIRPLVDRLAMPVYLVGGAVRDAVLARDNHDLDLAVPEDAIKLAFQIADALRLPAYALDEERDVGRVIMPDRRTTLDVARFRGPDLRADLHGRDFTMNAMALPVTARDAGSIIDPFHGLDDIRAGVIRLVHAGSVGEDPIRTLRALRQALQLDFTLAPATTAAIQIAGPALARVSPERVREELVRVIRGPQPDLAVAHMSDLGLLAEVLPEIAALGSVSQSPPHHEPVLEHTISVLRWLLLVEGQLEPGELAQETDLRAVADLLTPYHERIQAHLNRPIDGGLDGTTLLRLGGLFHDAGKRETQTIAEDGRIRFIGHDSVGAKLVSRRMQRLTFSNEAIEHVSRIVGGHMRPLLLATNDSLPTRRAIYRYYRATREAGIDVVLLSLADHLATYDGAGDKRAWQQLLDVNSSLLQGYFDGYEELVAPVRLVNGADLIAALELEPGREIGRLLSEIEEAQAAGQVTTRAEALDLARQLRDQQEKPAA